MTMTSEVAVREETRDIASIDLTAIERVIVAGDLSKLSPDERWSYYQGVCQSLGLNPFTQPFAYITMNGKLVMYALKGATEQLRRLYGVSLGQPVIQFDSGLCIVTVGAQDKTGRTDTDIGAVPVDGLRGEARANAVMKAITKSKRRVTLSLCGLGMLDETEIETIPNARPMALEAAHGHPETFDRERLERHYTALAGIATHAGHEQAERINKKKAADLDDGKLVGSVQVLRSWFPDVTDEQLDAEQVAF